MTRADALPLVSVIVPNYNNARFIRECLESVVQQRYPRIEVVVCDDASTDDSVRVVSAMMQTDSRIKLICNEKNSGVSYTRHRAIEQAQGSYITTLDSDDYYSNRDKIANELALIVAYAKRGVEIVAFSNIRILREDGSLSSLHVPIREGDLFASILGLNAFVPRDFTLSKKSYFEVGGYDFSMNLHEDTDLKLRLARNLPFYYTRAEGVVYRRKGYGLSYRNKKVRQNALLGLFERYAIWLDTTEVVAVKDSLQRYLSILEKEPL